MAVKRPNVLVSVKAVADFRLRSYDYPLKKDPDQMGWYPDYSAEAECKVLEKKAEELHQFLRDHRSQDLVSIDVERTYQDLCSKCGKPWEVYTDEGGKYCGHCGDMINE